MTEKELKDMDKRIAELISQVPEDIDNSVIYLRIHDSFGHSSMHTKTTNYTGVVNLVLSAVHEPEFGEMLIEAGSRYLEYLNSKKRIHVNKEKYDA
jgi:hypothetical protein